VFHSTRRSIRKGFDRLDSRFRQRLVGVVLALLIEGLLVLLILSLGLTGNQPKPSAPALVSVALRETADTQPEPAKAAAPQRAAKVPQRAETSKKTVAPTAVASAQPAQKPPPFVRITPGQLAGLDISQVPRQPSAAPAARQGPTGPPDLGVPGDSKRVGSAPNGQPMYAAAWYREPYDDELSGYLSTAQGPGWALIACRTAPNFRVENCTGLGESPDGSNIERAVLAAAWQFRVRPPRVGGVSQVGSWVRIRIDYTQPAR
jgi:periplasmic protein TonB